MGVLERGPLENLRTRVEEFRTMGVLPTVRARVEEIVTKVKNRTEMPGGGSVLTREVTNVDDTGVTTKKGRRGL